MHHFSKNQNEAKRDLGSTRLCQRYLLCIINPLHCNDIFYWEFFFLISVFPQYLFDSSVDNGNHLNIWYLNRISLCFPHCYLFFFISPPPSPFSHSLTPVTTATRVSGWGMHYKPHANYRLAVLPEGTWVQQRLATAPGRGICGVKGHQSAHGCAGEVKVSLPLRSGLRWVPFRPSASEIQLCQTAPLNVIYILSPILVEEGLWTCCSHFDYLSAFSCR